jgi:L-amino acid N-acyltransferase YncA
VEKTVTLRNGQEVVIRDMGHDDLQASFEFFQSLPAEDRKYLRVDVTRWELVKSRIGDVESGKVRRLVAVDEDAIVADGSLELAGHGWGDNIAEIRLIVSHPYQRLGLGSILARELFHLAAAVRVDRIVARFMRPQEGARRIMRSLGFEDEFLIPEHVRDRDGVWQDLIIMRCNLDRLWDRLETALAAEDWQRHR